MSADWSDYAGMPYFGVVTGSENEPGINGALMLRQSASPEANQGLNAYVCTIGVEDYDATESNVLKKGGKVAMLKMGSKFICPTGFFLNIFIRSHAMDKYDCWSLTSNLIGYSGIVRCLSK